MASAVGDSDDEMPGLIDMAHNSACSCGHTECQDSACSEFPANDDDWFNDFNSDNENSDSQNDKSIICERQKRKNHSDILITCSKHGDAITGLAVAFKCGLCRQCTTLNCGNCGPNSLANPSGNCIECKSDRDNKRYKCEVSEHGSWTHYVENACMLSKHLHCKVQTNHGLCILCHRNGAAIGSAIARTRLKKLYSAVELKRNDVYKMEGSICSVCDQAVFQSVISYDPMGLSLDRIDPSLGYTRANTTAMHYQCNLLKGQRTTSETRATLIDIYKTCINSGIIRSVPMDKGYAARFTDEEISSMRRRYRDVYAFVVANKRAHLRSKGIYFGLDTSNIKQMFEDQNGQCAICSAPCGRDITFDQIIAGYGYTEDNVQIVHHHCNCGKNRWLLAVLYETAAALFESIERENLTAVVAS